jgi:polysaccharide export outer membrane protein
MDKAIQPASLILSGYIIVLQAISLVGEGNKFANDSGIKVIRERLVGQETLPVSYKGIISGSDMSTNVQLKAGDNIVVP